MAAASAVPFRDPSYSSAVEDPPVVKVVATAFNLVVGLSPDRQMTFQSGFEGDEPDEIVNARIDRLLALSDRIRSRYEIPEAEEDLARSNEALANLLVDLERIDKQHEHSQAARRVQLAEMDSLCAHDIAEVDKTINVQILRVQDNKTAAMQRGVDAHRRAGKSGSYVPRDAVKADIDKCQESLVQFEDLRGTERQRLIAEYERSKASIESEIDKAEAERELHRGNQAINIERHRAGIAELEKKLARARALSGG